MVLMNEFHLLAFDSRKTFDHNRCEATVSQRLSSNITSPYFPDDMFDTFKCQKDFSFHLTKFEIEVTGYFFKYTVQSQAIFTYF
jgi:hypothetical protein